MEDHPDRPRTFGQPPASCASRWPWCRPSGVWATGSDRRAARAGPRSASSWRSTRCGPESIAPPRDHRGAPLLEALMAPNSCCTSANLLLSSSRTGFRRSARSLRSSSSNICRVSASSKPACAENKAPKRLETPRNHRKRKGKQMENMIKTHEKAWISHASRCPQAMVSVLRRGQLGRLQLLLLGADQEGMVHQACDMA